MQGESERERAIEMEGESDHERKRLIARRA